jgi:hypothetical protein
VALSRPHADVDGSELKPEPSVVEKSPKLAKTNMTKRFEMRAASFARDLRTSIRAGRDALT